MKQLVLLNLDGSTLALLRSVTQALNVGMHAVGQRSQLLGLLQGSKASDTVVVIGLDALIPAQRHASRVVAQVRERMPTATIVLHAERKFTVDAHDQAWAKMCGADAIIPRITASRWQHAGEPLIALLDSENPSPAKRQQRVQPYVRAAQAIEAGDETLRNLAAVEAMGIDLAQLARRIGRSGGVDIRDRSYHLRSYSECFVASECADWIAKAANTSRPNAIAIGKALQSCGLIYHVAREQAFADEYYFFRVARLPEQFVISDFYTQVSSAVGFEHRDRTYLGTEYKHCFVGKEAIAWCLKHRMTLNEAMSAGQRLIDLSIASHVVNEHPLKDDALFYRFHSA